MGIVAALTARKSVRESVLVDGGQRQSKKDLGPWTLDVGDGKSHSWEGLWTSVAGLSLFSVLASHSLLRWELHLPICLLMAWLHSLETVC